MKTSETLHGPRRQLVGLAVVLALASGCDFTPVLDIPLPEHEQRLVLRSILVADSTVSVRVSLSESPYVSGSIERYEASVRLLSTATVELVEDGQVVETLRRPFCRDFMGRNESYVGEEPYEQDERCGPFFSESRTDAGGTYTLRARVDGLPEASATVTLPTRVEVSEVEAVGERRVSFRLSDPTGLGQHYALQLSPITSEYENTYQVGCQPPDYRTGCRDTTVVERYSNPRRFRTNDPFLMAAARMPSTESLDLVAFDDQTFDGTERAFTLEPALNWVDFGDGPSRTSEEWLWLVVVDARTYDAYQATYFSLGDDNPFEEPANLPSNVVNGYGLVGAATIHARALPESPARHAGG